MSETPVSDRFLEKWDQFFIVDRYEELSDSDLYLLQDTLWAIHQDLVMEWSRRKMREAGSGR